MRLMAPFLIILLASCATAGDQEWSAEDPDGDCKADTVSLESAVTYRIDIRLLDADCEYTGSVTGGGGTITVGPSGPGHYIVLLSEVWKEDAFTYVDIDEDGTFLARSHRERPTADVYSVMEGSFCGRKVAAEYQVEFPSPSEDWSSQQQTDCFIRFSVRGSVEEADAGL